MYSLAEIANITSAEWVRQIDPSALVVDLVLDSRHAARSQTLFFAIEGRRHDGHHFIAEAYRSGCRHFVVARTPSLDELPEANILLVKDTLIALQQLAAWHRARFHYPVVGITGSNGKTIVKEWLYQLLQSDFDIVRSPKSYNSQVGVPLSVWQMEERHNLAIFEAGISLPGEMARLEPIIRPQIGIFTHIGAAHSEGFEHDRQKAEEKMGLFAAADALVYCADHEAVAGSLWLLPDTCQPIAWSKTPGKAPITLQSLRKRPDGSVTLYVEEQADGEKQLYELDLPFDDPASIDNAMHCYTLMRYLGYAPAIIARRMRQLERVEMRMQTKAGIAGSTLIDDAYSNDLSSLRLAMQHAAAVEPIPERRMLIASAPVQSGLSEERLYWSMAGMIREYGFHHVILIGEHAQRLAALLPGDLSPRVFNDTDDFLAQLPDINFQGKTILLKGARALAFERIARRLERKMHKTVLEINLNALIHNLNTYASLLPPGVKILVMVKAAAYGSGADEVARLLQYHRVDYLGVAYADEGVQLRQAGIELPILVLNPEPASFDPMYRYRLEPEVYSLDELKALTDYAGTTKAFRIHLKLDTGMHRLGFEADDIDALLAHLRAFPNLAVQSVFSHLSASDNPRHDDFTHVQAASFEAMSDRIIAGLGYRPLRHICNTGAISRFPQYHFDMVRLGIGLYGIDGAAGMQERLQVVNTLKATVSQVKTAPPGDTVGYNRNSGPLDQARRIATISIGYADGFLRLAGGGRHSVQVRGQIAPTIGNVCMDMTMIDVTHIEGVTPGDEVIIFGENPPVQTLATALQTIPYEIFTNISERVNRVYIRE